MKFDIYIADYNKTKVLQVPIIPKELPSLSSSISNEEFATYWNGAFNFIEKPGLLSFPIESWWPMKKYSFARSSYMATDFITLLNNAINKTEPVRVVITCSDGSTYVNDTFSIESFSYNANQNGDYVYSLGLKQWRDYNV